MSVESEMVAALNAGREAGRIGAPALANPYDGLSGDPRQRVLAKMWRRGYTDGSPIPADWPTDVDL